MAGWTTNYNGEKFEHTHWNMNVLNKFSENANDEPLYDGKAICKCGTQNGGFTYTQTTLTGVTASEVSPKVVNIAMSKTSDFCTVPTWVEYLIPGNEEVENEYSFNHSDAALFNATGDDQVVFDGTMHLETKYVYPFTLFGALNGSGQYSEAVWVDPTEWKSIEKVEVA